MSYAGKWLLIGLILATPLLSFCQERKDSVQTSLSFSISFGMMRDAGLDAISFLTSYNPSYNLKYKRVELGLGLDYYRYTFRLPDRYSIENIYSFSSYLRCYFFKKQYLYAELFLNTGYWESKGELDLFEGNRGISTYGIGLGVIIPPLPRYRNHKFFKNVYGIMNLRQSFIHRDILLFGSDTNFGLIYKF